MWLRLSCFLLFLLAGMGTSRAQQTLKIPSPDALRTSEDFDKYEDTFIQSVEWLNSRKTDHPNRTLVSAFVFKWIEGTSKVTITLDDYIMRYVDKNPELLLIFLGNWAKYAIENPRDAKDALRCNQAGLDGLLTYYESHAMSLKKDKRVEKLLKKRAKGQLEEWLSRRI